MVKDEIIAILKREKPTLEACFGVEELALFGSYARGEETPESDVDILVKVQTPDFSKLVRLMNYLEDLFHKKIDLVRKGPHLSSRFFRIIGNNIIYV